jgi:hypothetical protein
MTCVPADQRSTTNDQRRTINDERSTTNDQRRTTSDRLYPANFPIIANSGM